MLPDKIMHEILLHLPPETLVKFTSVCKSWYSTIRSPSFVAQHKSHFTNNNNSNGGLVVNTGDSLEYFSQEIQSNVELKPWVMESSSLPYLILGSCDGLLCYGSARYRDVRVRLCNPSIRWARTLPAHRFDYEKENNLHQLHSHGIGFDRSTSDYKVVKVSDTGPMFRSAAVYSVKAGCWKSVDPPVIPEMLFDSSVFFQGFVHWTLYARRGVAKMLVFDVCNEVFGEMLLPDRGLLPPAKEEHKSISVVKGSLCFLIGEVIGNDTVCRLWSMREYRVPESWTKELEVVLRQRISWSIGVTYWGKLVCLASKSRGGLAPFDMEMYDPDTTQHKNAGRVPRYSLVFPLVASLELFGVEK